MSEKWRQEQRDMTKKVTELTGQWYCSAGAHWAKGEFTTRNKRRVCKGCLHRMIERRKAG